jgi:hypothetical protein
MEAGEKIWVESILSPEEYKQVSKTYPNCFKNSEPPKIFECDFKWRWNMGASLTQVEISIISKRLDEMLKLVKK